MLFDMTKRVPYLDVVYSPRPTFFGNRHFDLASGAFVTARQCWNRELFTLLESTADAAFSVDELGMIRSWNRAAEKLFGYPSAKVLDHPCAALFQGRGPTGQRCLQ